MARDSVENPALWGVKLFVNDLMTQQDAERLQVILRGAQATVRLRKRVNKAKETAGVKKLANSVKFATAAAIAT